MLQPGSTAWPSLQHGSFSSISSACGGTFEPGLWQPLTFGDSPAGWQDALSMCMYGQEEHGAVCGGVAFWPVGGQPAGLSQLLWRTGDVDALARVACLAHQLCLACPARFSRGGGYVMEAALQRYTCLHLPGSNLECCSCST